MTTHKEKQAGTVLLILTFLLVTIGCVLYVLDWVGWAQFLWVLASGTAGAGVVLFVGQQ